MGYGLSLSMLRYLGSWAKGYSQSLNVLRCFRSLEEQVSTPEGYNLSLSWPRYLVFFTTGRVTTVMFTKRLRFQLSGNWPLLADYEAYGWPPLLF